MAFKESNSTLKLEFILLIRHGNLANHSFRTSKNNSLIHIGEKESYEPLSRVEFQKELNLRDKKKANI